MWLKAHGSEVAAWLAGLSLVVASLLYLGALNQRVQNTHERIDRLVEQINTLNQRLDNALHEIDAAKRQAVAEVRALTVPQDNPVIFADGRLASGYNMGVNTSGGRTNWVSINQGAVCMAYPGGDLWGAVFITVGESTDPPRPGRDLSRYQRLSLELRAGRGRDSVLVGMKDSTDPDDGSETKVPVRDLSTDWKTYTVPLTTFRTADLRSIYIPAEFVFGHEPATVCFRKIQLLP
jgi:hypothetical protein